MLNSILDNIKIFQEKQIEKLEKFKEETTTAVKNSNIKSEKKEIEETIKRNLGATQKIIDCTKKQKSNIKTLAKITSIKKKACRDMALVRVEPLCSESKALVKQGEKLVKQIEKKIGQCTNNPEKCELLSDIAELQNSIEVLSKRILKELPESGRKFNNCMKEVMTEESKQILQIIDDVKKCAE